jgi:hypothetical protein
MTLHSRPQRIKLLALFWTGILRLDLFISAVGALAIATFALLSLPPDAVVTDVLAQQAERALVIMAVLLVSGGYLLSVLMYLLTSRREIPFFQNHGLDAVRLLVFSFFPTAAVAAAIGAAARLLL